ncbi:MAG: sulfotransferase domain-containing protein [Thermomicrobiales bacterium]|nr:sulfotransferase domain-containing protein [Thermomicrobiales bacterium]
MRIIIAGPPKAGNVWLKCIISNIYDLRVLTIKETPQRPQIALFKEWIGADGFPDGTVFHQHYDFSTDLCDAIDSVPAHTLTIIRDPYDTFVSSYYTIQQHKDSDIRRGRRDQIAGKNLSDPEVYVYLRNGGFRNNMRRALEWVESGRTHVIRYEKLHSDPIAELTAVTDAIQPVPRERIERAVEACSAENMRKKDNKRTPHVRSAKVGDSKAKLNEEHLEIFRELHADTIRALGYEVR